MTSLHVPYAPSDSPISSIARFLFPLVTAEDSPPYGGVSPCFSEPFADLDDRESVAGSPGQAIEVEHGTLRPWLGRCHTAALRTSYPKER